MSRPKRYLKIVTDAGTLAPWGTAAVISDVVVPFPCLPCAHLPQWVAVADTDARIPCGPAVTVTGILAPFPWIRSNQIAPSNHAGNNGDIRCHRR